MNKIREHIILSGIALLFFVPGLGAVHLFDWDEINFAESAREMLLTGSWWNVTVNFESFWEKPPLFIWLQALSMKIFGVGEFAARLPNALAGMATLNVIWWIAAKEKMRRTGVWWVAFYLGSIAPHFYFRSGIIDPWFNLFIFLGYYQIYILLSGTHRAKNAALAGLFLGLAVLTKGPVALLIILLSVLVLVVLKRKFWFGWKEICITALSACLVVSVWLLPLLYNNGTGFISSFLGYQLDLLLNPVASHGQPFYYHFIVLLFLSFPASILAFSGEGKSKSPEFRKWMLVLFWTVLLLFSAVTTKIVHYSSMCYLPLTFLAADRIVALREHRAKFAAVVMAVLAIVGLVLTLVFIAIPLVGVNAQTFVERFGSGIRDPFALENLMAPSQWRGFEWVISILFLLGTISIVVGKYLRRHWFILSGLCLNALFIALFSFAVVPAIEGHTQGSIIAFYEKLQGEQIYIHPYRFKTYAHYFYTRTGPLNEKDGLYHVRQGFYIAHNVDGQLDLTDSQRKELSEREFNYLLSDSVDRPVYLICQTKKKGELEEWTGLAPVFSGGGFYVFRHRPYLSE